MILFSVFKWIGDVISSSFVVLPALGQLPNYLFIVVGTVLFIYWMIQLFKFGNDDKPM